MIKIRYQSNQSVDLIFLIVILSFDFAIVCYALENRSCLFVMIAAEESWEAASDKFTSFM